MAGGGGSSTVNVNSGPVTVDADSTVDIKGLDNIKVTLQPSPLKTESKTELILPQPLRTDSKLDTHSDLKSDSTSAMSVDLKPIALDVCLNTSSKLPQGRIHQPFTFNLGFTWFGMEVFGIKLGGEARTVLEDLPQRPAFDLPAQHNAPAPRGAPARDDRVSTTRDAGLRIRVK